MEALKTKPIPGRPPKLKGPQIKKLAKKHKATIYFGGEAAVHSDYHKGTTWAPKGQTPVVESTGASFRVNMISAISARGHMRFMTIKGRLNSDRFIEFLKRLIHNAQHPVFLIVDGHPAHRSGKVSRYVESTKGWLQLFEPLKSGTSWPVHHRSAATVLASP